jgi:MFS family permease
MPADETGTRAIAMGPLQWTICVVAAVGFAFDIYVILVMPLIVRPALADLGGLTPGAPAYNDWTGALFWLPAIAGGIFGLLGGYLTDRFGRLRVLVWSILLYALGALAAAYATSLSWFLLWRTLTFVGVCVEFVAAIAWLAELFPDPRQREIVLGYTQVFSSIGGLLVSAVNYLANHYAESLPQIYGGHPAWRYTLISAILPAILLAFVRPFLPESTVWRQKRALGELRRPRIAELFRPAYRRTSIATAILVACGYGAGFGAFQQLPQIVPGISEVAQLTPTARAKVVAGVQFIHEMGGLAGRIAMAALAVFIAGRRILLRSFLFAGVVIVPLVYFYPAIHNLHWLRIGIFVVGFLTVAQYSFWGNYLPRVYPTYLRGTGESFAVNIGGRMIGSSAAFVTTSLAKVMPAAFVSVKFAYAATIVALFVYVLGFATSFWLPEPAEKLPD